MKALLLYDGGCGPCTAFARWVKMVDFTGRIEARPLEDPETEKRYRGRLGPRYMESFHLDTGRGVKSGAEALPDLLGLLPGGRLWAPLARAPLLFPLLERVYGRLSRARVRSGCVRSR